MTRQTLTKSLTHKKGRRPKIAAFQNLVSGEVQENILDKKESHLKLSANRIARSCQIPKTYCSNLYFPREEVGPTSSLELAFSRANSLISIDEELFFPLHSYYFKLEKEGRSAARKLLAKS